MESNERLKRLATIPIVTEMPMGDARYSFRAADDDELKEFLKENFDEITGEKKHDTE